MKHSAFVTKIEKKSTQKKKRSRGSSQRLQTQLEGLADALPQLEEAAADSDDGDEDWEGMSEDEDLPAQAAEGDMLGALAGMVNVRKSIKKKAVDENDGKMKLKTLTSNRGAAKRRAKLEGRERERFAKNLAEMSKPVASGGAVAGAAAAPAAGGPTGDRWAALRGFIGQTLETNPNFKKA